MVSISALMVEDNPADAELLVEELESCPGTSFSIRHARTLKSAHELLNRDRFDLIFLDLSLPDSIGLDTLASIRSQSDRTPVIVLTGLDDHETALYAARMRVSDYLVKGSYSLDTLQRAIREALKDWEASAQLRGADQDSVELILAREESRGHGVAGEGTRGRSLERAVDRERALLAAAVSSAEDSVIITDRNGVMLYVNPAFSRVTGYSQQEVLGNSVAMLGDGEQARLLGVIQEELEAGRTWSGPLVNRRKSGEEVRVEATVTSVRGPDGAIENYVVVARDVTALAELQRQLNQSMRLNAIGKLASGIAHDFNNVLQAILSYGVSLSDATRTRHPELHPYASGVVDAANRAAKLTRQLLAFGRSQALQPEILDINDLIEGAANLLQRVIGEDIALELSLTRPLPPVEVDASQVEQIVVNLCVNARQAMPDGGELRVATDRAALSPAFCQSQGWATPGDYVRLTIADSGEGIAADVMEHMFEPFYSTRSEGTGMGLATVYGIVKQQRGLIHCDSRPGEGATFSIYFPVAEAPAPTPSESPQPHMPPQDEAEGGPDGGRILVAEDDATLATLAKMLLEGAGFDVVVASDGERAWEELCLAAEPFSLVLCDVVMPRLGGPDLLERVMASTVISRKPRFLMSSGYDTASTSARRASMEHVAYLQKPYTPAELLMAVRRLLKG